MGKTLHDKKLIQQLLNICYVPALNAEYQCATNKPDRCPHRKDSQLTRHTLSEALIAEAEVHSGGYLTWTVPRRWTRPHSL